LGLSMSHTFGWTAGVGSQWTALSLGERVARSGAFISPSADGDG